MVFKVDTTYLGKAAAKDAVARVALEAGVTKKLQAYFIKHLAPASEMARKLEETPEPARQAQGKPKREQADWVANLAGREPVIASAWNVHTLVRDSLLSKYE